MNIGGFYVFWFFISPFANIVLNFAQYSSVKALFYISNKVYENGKLRQQLQHNPRIQQLYDIYTRYDTDEIADEWSVDELTNFLSDHTDILIKNKKVTRFIFDTLMYLQDKKFGKKKKTHKHKHKKKNKNKDNGTLTKQKNDKNKNKNKGLKWQTILYLFETELTYVTDRYPTHKILDSKIHLLNQCALNAFRTRTHTRTRTRLRSSKTRRRKEYRFDTNWSDEERQKKIELFGRTIESLNDSAIESIAFISHQDELDKQKQLLTKLNYEISLAKHEVVYNVNYWILLFCRCVPCRVGCKTDKIVENHSEIEQKKLIENKLRVRHSSISTTTGMHSSVNNVKIMKSTTGELSSIDDIEDDTDDKLHYSNRARGREYQRRRSQSEGMVGFKSRQLRLKNRRGTHFSSNSNNTNNENDKNNDNNDGEVDNEFINDLPHLSIRETVDGDSGYNSDDYDDRDDNVNINVNHNNGGGGAGGGYNSNMEMHNNGSSSSNSSSSIRINMNINHIRNNSSTLHSNNTNSNSSGSDIGANSGSSSSEIETDNYTTDQDVDNLNFDHDNVSDRDNITPATKNININSNLYPNARMSIKTSSVATIANTSDRNLNTHSSCDMHTPSNVSSTMALPIPTINTDVKNNNINNVEGPIGIGNDSANTNAGNVSVVAPLNINFGVSRMSQVLTMPFGNRIDSGTGSSDVSTSIGHMSTMSGTTGASGSNSSSNSGSSSDSGAGSGSSGSSGSSANNGNSGNSTNSGNSGTSTIANSNLNTESGQGSSGSDCDSNVDVGSVTNMHLRLPNFNLNPASITPTTDSIRGIHGLIGHGVADGGNARNFALQLNLFDMSNQSQTDINTVRNPGRYTATVSASREGSLKLMDTERREKYFQRLNTRFIYGSSSDLFESKHGSRSVSPRTYHDIKGLTASTANINYNDNSECIEDINRVIDVVGHGRRGKHGRHGTGAGTGSGYDDIDDPSRTPTYTPEMGTTTALQLDIASSGPSMNSTGSGHNNSTSDGSDIGGGTGTNKNKNNDATKKSKHSTRSKGSNNSSMVFSTPGQQRSPLDLINDTLEVDHDGKNDHDYLYKSGDLNDVISSDGNIGNRNKSQTANMRTRLSIPFVGRNLLSPKNKKNRKSKTSKKNDSIKQQATKSEAVQNKQNTESEDGDKGASDYGYDHQNSEHNRLIDE